MASKTFKALLSSSASSFATRMVAHDGSFFRPDGSPITSSWSRLLGNVVLNNPVNLDQNGVLISGQIQPFTGSDPDGSTTYGGTCDDWTGVDGQALVGAGFRTQYWINYTYTPCETAGYLFCVEE